MVVSLNSNAKHVTEIMNHETSINDLPKELIWKIFSYLSQDDLTQAQAVNKSWKKNVTAFSKFQAKTALKELLSVVKSSPYVEPVKSQLEDSLTCIEKIDTASSFVVVLQMVKEILRITCKTIVDEADSDKLISLLRQVKQLKKRPDLYRSFKKYIKAYICVRYPEDYFMMLTFVQKFFDVGDFQEAEKCAISIYNQTDDIRVLDALFMKFLKARKLISAERISYLYPKNYNTDDYCSAIIMKYLKSYNIPEVTRFLNLIKFPKNKDDTLECIVIKSYNDGYYLTAERFTNLIKFNKEFKLNALLLLYKTHFKLGNHESAKRVKKTLIYNIRPLKFNYYDAPTAIKIESMIDNFEF